MRVQTPSRAGQLSLRLTPEPHDALVGDGQGGNAVRLIATSCRVEHGPRDEPHPDLVALATLFVVRPWVGRRLHLDRGVSPRLAEAVTEEFGLELGPIDDALRPRVPGPQLTVAFSGGTDIIAALTLLPDDLDPVLVHHRRVRHPVVPPVADEPRPWHHERIVRWVGERGHRTHIVRSDLEYLCAPHPTFPFWLALLIGPLLLADESRAGGVALGAVLGTRYLGGGRRIITPSEAPARRLLQAVGLDLVEPVAGASEVLTTRLASRSPIGELALSCPLGTAHQGCGRCEKCVRKDLIEAALEGRDPSAATTEAVEAAGRLRDHLLESWPLHQQHVLEWAVARLEPPRDSVLDHVRRRTRARVDDTAWVERYLPDAIDRSLGTWRSRIEPTLRAAVDLMGPGDLAAMRRWDPSQRRPLPATATEPSMPA
jgi:hypothetical protein